MNYDSILTAIDSTCVNRSEFYKTGKDVPDHDIAMMERVSSVCDDGVLVTVLLVLAFVVASVVSVGREMLIKRMKGFFVGKRTSTGTVVGSSTAEPFLVFLLVLVTAMCYAIPLFQLQAMRCTYVELYGYPYVVLAGIFLVLVAYIFLKAVSYKFINWVFFDREISVRWLSSYFFATAAMSFVAFPIASYLLLNDSSAEIVSQTFVFMLFCYEILLILRLFINFTPQKYGILSFFLYLCSAELIPAIILWRLHDVAAVWLSVHHIVE